MQAETAKTERKSGEKLTEEEIEVLTTKYNNIYTDLYKKKDSKGNVVPPKTKVPIGKALSVIKALTDTFSFQCFLFVISVGKL